MPLGRVFSATLAIMLENRKFTCCLFFFFVWTPEPHDSVAQHRGGGDNGWSMNSLTVACRSWVMLVLFWAFSCDFLSFASNIYKDPGSFWVGGDAAWWGVDEEKWITQKIPRWLLILAMINKGHPGLGQLGATCGTVGSKHNCNYFALNILTAI